jgi:hypothetical protein
MGPALSGLDQAIRPMLVMARVHLPAQGYLGQHGPRLVRTGPGHPTHAGHGDSGIDRIHSDPVWSQLQCRYPAYRNRIVRLTIADLRPKRLFMFKCCTRFLLFHNSLQLFTAENQF